MHLSRLFIPKIFQVQRCRHINHFSITIIFFRLNIIRNLQKQSPNNQTELWSKSSRYDVFTNVTQMSLPINRPQQNKDVTLLHSIFLISHFYYFRFCSWVKVHIGSVDIFQAIFRCRNYRKPNALWFIMALFNVLFLVLRAG